MSANGSLATTSNGMRPLPTTDDSCSPMKGSQMYRTVISIGYQDVPNSTDRLEVSNNTESSSVNKPIEVNGEDSSRASVSPIPPAPPPVKPKPLATVRNKTKKISQKDPATKSGNCVSGLSNGDIHMLNGHSNHMDDRCVKDFEKIDIDHFHVNEQLNRRKTEVNKHSCFVGSRDVKNPDSLRETKIISAKGTVRGFKNRVRAGIATFLEQQDEVKKNYRQTEKGKIVMYVTSMRIIRGTRDKCKKVKNILQTHMVEFEERDVFMSTENQKDLMERLGVNEILVPHVFADGQSLGNSEQIEKLNETGELRKIFRHFSRVDNSTSCSKCGGYRFVPCMCCHGSKKSLHRNHFTEEFCALRCVVCDESGLIRCDNCKDQVDK